MGGFGGAVHSAVQLQNPLRGALREIDEPFAQNSIRVGRREGRREGRRSEKREKENGERRNRRGPSELRSVCRFCLLWLKRLERLERLLLSNHGSLCAERWTRGERGALAANSRRTGRAAARERDESSEAARRSARKTAGRRRRANKQRPAKRERRRRWGGERRAERKREKRKRKRWKHAKKETDPTGGLAARSPRSLMCIQRSNGSRRSPKPTTATPESTGRSRLACDRWSPYSRLESCWLAGDRWISRENGLEESTSVE